MQSFSSAAKNEICQITSRDCCTMAELYALTFACGNININSDGLQIKYNTENMVVGKRIFDTVTRALKLDADVEVKDNLLKKRHTYAVIVNNGGLLLQTLDTDGNILADARPPAYMLEKDCCKAAMLRGAFLGGGSVSNPKKNYHLEFALNSESFARLIRDLLAKFDIKTKIIRRKQNYVVYLNEGDGIAAALAMIGAHSSVLNLENVRIMKEMRNNVNRAVNCETANINKTVNAAMTQLNSIHIIEKQLGIEKLSDALREAAHLRMECPEATLQELCELCGTTKSAMNHRLRKINAIAETLQREDVQ